MAKTSKQVDSLHKLQSEIREILFRGLHSFKVDEKHIEYLGLEITSKAIDYAGEFHRQIMNDIREGR